jgi:acyl-CoA thioester hydrolase
MKNSPNSENSSPDPALASPTPVELTVRVRYSETDRMGVAHNKNYFEWFEIGRTEFFRRKGIPYRSLEAKGYFLVVVEAFCRYKKALHYDDTFNVHVRLCEMTPKKANFAYQLWSKDRSTLIAEGYTTHLVTNRNTEVCKLPPYLFLKLEGCVSKD